MADLGAVAVTFRHGYVRARTTVPPAHIFPSAHRHTAWAVVPLTVITRSSLLRAVYSPPWWGARAIGELPLPNFKIEGHVYQRDEDGNDTPIHLCRVHLHVRRSGVLIGISRTDAAGHYRFDNLLPVQGGFYTIALDPDGAPLQNAVVLDRLQPGPA